MKRPQGSANTPATTPFYEIPETITTVRFLLLTGVRSGEAFGLGAGVDLKVVSALLGHASIATSANLYTDVLERTKAEAAREVAAKQDLG